MGRVYAQLTWVFRRHRSTIFRELRCNRFQEPCMAKVVGYFAMAAQLRTSGRRAKERYRLKATPRKCLG